jgi:alpha-glucosidase (family GH31 glycosyl hydrolase)
MAHTSFEFHTCPLADPDAVILGPNVRISVLTSRLLRLEFDPQGKFEDRPSQAFWFRHQMVPAFQKKQDSTVLEIETEHLRLSYRVSPNGFTSQNLSIEMKETGFIWHFGDSPASNLRGTGRTLDEANGPIRLEQGLVSRQGWVLVDDSRSLVFNSKDWLESRPVTGALDLYFFGYGHDYSGCLQDFTKIAGAVPMVPRWILGNWWSRYWAYTQAELKTLIEEFQTQEIPLSICIIDMDWHITQTGNASPGWTGYTWNRQLFPDPEAFIAWLHQQGLHTALNLHPADGVYPHEEQYPQMASAMGIDPASRQPVPFDISDSQFMRNYFDILHHPMEEKGVDFWWIDWQQGTNSKIANLDPLWGLNHLHFLDAGRNEKQRPFIFSRWGGLGNHRYPIGFSGDSIITWESLAFQPYFTSTAANVNYGWWSHDIGGHNFGVEDRELYTRWVQFGVFSPILRLHSTNNPYHERRPWGYDAEVLRITRNAFQLRHALIPYLYSMAWRNTQQSCPLITPMYYDDPEKEDAYHCPDQYRFGSELVVAPFLTPSNPDTRLSRGSIWLPEGDWFNFFDGEYYPGNAWYPLFGKLDDIPVFAQAGSIVPLAPFVKWGGIGNPEELTLVLFPGASHRFELFEDDGVSQDYKKGDYCLTTIEQTWSEAALQVTIQPVQGDRSDLPENRRYTLTWRGVSQPAKIEVTIDGTTLHPKTTYDAGNGTLTLEEISLKSESRLAARLIPQVGKSLLLKRDRRLETCRKLLWSFHCSPDLKKQIDARLEEILIHPGVLVAYERQLTEAQMGTLIQEIRKKG